MDTTSYRIEPHCAGCRCTKPAPEPSLTLDDQHRYWLSGRRIPGVSESLRVSGVALIPPRFADALEARDLGFRVHKACELFDIGQDPYRFEQEAGTPELSPYLGAWERFRKDYKAIDVFPPESKVTDGKGACTPDRVMRFESAIHWGRQGDVYVVEIKTGEEAPWWKIQLAAQAQIVRDGKSLALAPARLAVQLCKEDPHRFENENRGRYIVRFYGPETFCHDRDLWYAARAIAQHRINTGTL